MRKILALRDKLIRNKFGFFGDECDIREIKCRWLEAELGVSRFSFLEISRSINEAFMLVSLNNKNEIKVSKYIFDVDSKNRLWALFLALWAALMALFATSGDGF